MPAWISRAGGRWCPYLLSAALLTTVLTGCGRLHPPILDRYVYVTAKQAFLRDRVAAVSNRTGTVGNGDKLVVLDHSRRFVKVRSPHGEVGWIEERLTADQGVADQFEQLKQGSAKDTVIAHATARDEVYLHLSPGRDTERFFRLVEGDNLSLLQRATVVKTAAPNAPPPAQAKLLPGRSITRKIEGGKSITKAVVDSPSEGPPQPVMEDWWLVRDAGGQTGWIYSRMIDVAAPDALARYSEGQRIVGAYVLTHVDDPESNILNNGQPVTSIPEYVTVLSPFKAGLPYDFDQVRVFIWNVKKHRYETAFREHNVAGYLPVKIGESRDMAPGEPMYGKTVPNFTYNLLPADAPLPAPDPTTGLVKPSRTIAKTLLLEGNICRRLLPAGTAVPEQAKPNPESEKEKARKHRH